MIYSCVSIGTEKEIDLAVKAAKKAFPSWKNTSLIDRVNIVEKFADWLEKEYGAEGEQTRLKNTNSR